MTLRNKLILLAILFQFIVLGYMAGEREYIFRKGKIIYLRTAPLDPRDLFRGDFVRLNYEISTVSHKNIDKKFKSKPFRKGDIVYAVLEEKPDKVAELLYVSDKKPDKGLFIRGRIHHRWWHRFSSSNRAVNIKYGIETYFVQQGKGKKIEKRRGNRRGIQIPLEMKIAVSKGGKAIIKGHRWSPLGIGLEVSESPRRNSKTGRKSAKIRLTLKNASNNPIALIDLPDYRSFSLEPSGRASKNWTLSQSFDDFIKPTNDDVIVLKPNEKKFFDFDFSHERWRVKSNEKSVEIGTLEWREMFRIYYRPPSEKDCRLLDKKELIWHGYLPSRAFHGRGNVD
jgi:uncharacterized membrane-anchored protein